MLRRLFYLNIRQTLPRLRHHLTSGRKLDTYDEQINVLLEAGLVRDWDEGKRLVERRRKSIDALFWELSKKRQPDWRRRLRFMLIRFWGGYTFDPHASELRELEQQGKEIQ